MSFYCASRLPFAKPQTRLQLNHGPNATPATAISPRQTLCTSKQSLTLCQCRFMALQGCRVPGLKRACSSITAHEHTSLQLVHGLERLRPQQFLSLPTGHSCHRNLDTRPRQTLCSSNNSNQSLRRCQCLFMELQGCRLPALKRACSSITAQTPLLPQQSLRGRPSALPSSP